MLHPINSVKETPIVNNENPKNITATSFRANDYERTPNKDTVELSSSNNSNKNLLIGLGVAVAAATLGIIGHKQGWFKKAVEKAKPEEKPKEDIKEEIKKTFKELYDDAIKNKKESIKNETTGKTHSFEYDKDGKLIKETVTKGEDKAEYTIIDDKLKLTTLTKDGKVYTKKHKLEIADFKQKGNTFEQGIAKLKNGRNYSGTITIPKQDGSRVVLEYNDGILQKSTSFKDENVISSKTYSFKDGKIDKIVDNNGKTLYETFTIDKGAKPKIIKTEKASIHIDPNTNKVKMVIIKNSPTSEVCKMYNDSGVLKYERIYNTENPEKKALERAISYYEDGKTKQLEKLVWKDEPVFSDCIMYDKNGNMTDKISGINRLNPFNQIYEYQNLSSRRNNVNGLNIYELSDSNGNIVAQIESDVIEGGKDSITSYNARIVFNNKTYNVRSYDTNEGNIELAFIEKGNRSNAITYKSPQYKEVVDTFNNAISEIRAKSEKAKEIFKILDTNTMNMSVTSSNYRSDLA